VRFHPDHGTFSLIAANHVRLVAEAMMHQPLLPRSWGHSRSGRIGLCCGLMGWSRQVELGAAGAAGDPEQLVVDVWK